MNRVPATASEPNATSRRAINPAFSSAKPVNGSVASVTSTATVVVGAAVIVVPSTSSVDDVVAGSVVEVELEELELEELELELEELELEELELEELELEELELEELELVGGSVKQNVMWDSPTSFRSIEPPSAGPQSPSTIVSVFPVP
jgi:hypothetical protein